MQQSLDSTSHLSAGTAQYCRGPIPNDSGAAPAQSGYENLVNSEGDFGRMARGSAGVAELIHSHSLGAWGNISILEQTVRLQQGACHANQPWSLDGHARMEIAELNGHRTLKKLAITVRLYERSQLQPPEVVRLWVAAVCKATIEAKNPNGNWTMSWPLLGIPGPDSLFDSAVAKPHGTSSVGGSSQGKQGSGRRGEGRHRFMRESRSGRGRQLKRNVKMAQGTTAAIDL